MSIGNPLTMWLPTVFYLAVGCEDLGDLACILHWGPDLNNEDRILSPELFNGDGPEGAVICVNRTFRSPYVQWAIQQSQQRRVPLYWVSDVPNGTLGYHPVRGRVLELVGEQIIPDQETIRKSLHQAWMQDWPDRVFGRWSSLEEAPPMLHKLMQGRLYPYLRGSVTDRVSRR